MYTISALKYNKKMFKTFSNFISILHLSKPKLSKQFLCRQALPSNICSMGKHVNALDGIAGGLFALELLTRDCSLLSTLKGLG